MMKRFLLLLSMIALASLFSCCVSERSGELVYVNQTVTCNKPYILANASCCLDINENGVCDITETTVTTILATTTTREPAVTTTPQATTSTVPAGTCADGMKNQGETGIDCGGPCKQCPTRCDLAVNATGVKPAERSAAKLCLSSSEPVSYAGLNLTAKMDAGGADYLLVAQDASGTKTESSFGQGKDIAVGSVIFRFMGGAKVGGEVYVSAYAWVTEDTIACTTNADCGPERMSGYGCQQVKYVVKNFIYYRCLQPGTVLSECQAQQRFDYVETCQDGEECMAGEDKCLPRECFNNVADKDEDGIDCGGSCRPCHCFDKSINANELGLDCGGDCMPCVVNLYVNKTLPTIKLKSPANKVYAKQLVDLIYDVSVPASWCGYSLNGAPNITVRGNWSVYARAGVNEIVLYCNDSLGAMNHTSQRFNVSLVQGQACTEDPVLNSYQEHFDNVTLYVDDSSHLGVPDRCTTKTFEYALTYVNDTDPHGGIIEGSGKMSDLEFEPGRTFQLSYKCIKGLRLEASYIHASKNADPRTLSRLKLLVYFVGNKSATDISSFWRIYPYAPGGSVAEGTYVDIPYNPAESKCKDKGGVNASYQELDLTALLEKPQMKTIDLRIGLYTSGIETDLPVQELELLAEKQRR